MEGKICVISLKMLLMGKVFFAEEEKVVEWEKGER